MDLKAGDRVELIDDELSGIVEEVIEDEVVIKTSEGFVMKFPVSQIVKIEDDLESFEGEPDMNEILKEKQIKKKKSAPRIKPKERNLPPMEVDLHIHQLVRSTKGMSNHEMLNIQLDTARHKLEFAIRKRIQKIVFIHGVGEGVLKMELEYLFGRYSNVKFYDADYQKYGLGATEVYIYQNS